MAIIYESGYTLPVADEPLSRARMAHADNWLTGGTATASSTATGYSADAPLNTLTYEKWKPTSLAATWDYDHGASATCDYCCIAGHNISDGANTVAINYWDGAAWIGIVPATTITTNESIMCIFEPQAAQEWRMRLSVAGTSEPEIAVIKFGTALQFPQAILGGHGPINYARNTILRGNKSETGEYLGRTVQRTSLQTSYEWTHLDYSWIDANWADAQTAIEAEPFFLAWRPDKDGVVAFGQVDDSPAPQFMGIKDRMSLSMNMRALAHD